MTENLLADGCKLLLDALGNSKAGNLHGSENIPIADVLKKTPFIINYYVCSNLN